jgi:hypothetical protein
MELAQEAWTRDADTYRSFCGSYQPTGKGQGRNEMKTTIGSIAAVLVFAAGTSVSAQQAPGVEGRERAAAAGEQARAAAAETRERRAEKDAPEGAARPLALKDGDFDEIGRLADKLSAADVNDEELSGLVGSMFQSYRHSPPEDAAASPDVTVVRKEVHRHCGLIPLTHRLLDRGLRGKELLEAIRREHRCPCLSAWRDRNHPHWRSRVETFRKIRGEGLKGRPFIEAYWKRAHEMEDRDRIADRGRPGVGRERPEGLRKEKLSPRGRMGRDGRVSPPTDAKKKRQGDKD